MNVVVDERLSDVCLELINPKYHVSYVECKMENTEYDLEELVGNIHARCGARCASRCV